MSSKFLPGYLAPIVLLATCTAGCAAWFGDEKSEKQQAKELYFRAKNALQSRHYTDALEKYRQLETSFPFSRYSQNAALEQAYAHYKSHQYEEAITILDQFIRLNPDYAHVDYAYYLKGLSHYNYAQGPLNRILKRDRTNKDPTPMIEAFNAFMYLQKNHPGNRYKNDAWLRVVALRNMLAVHEIRIADYYMRRRAYLAVINRCKYVLENYPGAQHTPEALSLLAEAYRRTGSPGLEKDTLRVLERNYPGFTGKTDGFGRVSEKDRKSWMSNLKDLSDTALEFLRIKPRY